MKKEIWYLGKKLQFQIEVGDADEAEALIDQAIGQGREACALHENGKHQVYAELKKKKKQVSARSFFRGVPDRGVDY